MKPNKKLVLEILKTIHFKGQTSDIVSDNSVLNVVVFNNEILIDININNPSLQAKNNIKSKILKSIKSKFNQKIDIKINFKLKAETNKTILNLNRKLDNISNTCYIIRKRRGGKVNSYSKFGYIFIANGL